MGVSGRFGAALCACLAAAAWAEPAAPARRMLFAEAEKAFFPGNDREVGWGEHQIARGGKELIVDERGARGPFGLPGWYNTTVTTVNRAGTVVAVPVGDFQVHAYFEYSAPGAAASCLTGAVVWVEVQISSGASTPTEMVMHNAVKNLTVSGMALPQANGGKPMRIMALRKSAGRRFGGKNPRAHFDAPSGRVYLVLEDCRAANADPTYVPATPEGLSARDRQKLVTLRKDEDKGGLTLCHALTDIHPVARPPLPLREHLPAEGRR